MGRSIFIAQRLAWAVEWFQAEKNTAAGGNEKINLFFIAIGGSRDCLQRSDYLKRNHGMKISELLHK